jgi:hypothetical protein
MRLQLSVGISAFVPVLAAAANGVAGAAPLPLGRCDLLSTVRAAAYAPPAAALLPSVPAKTYACPGPGLYFPGGARPLWVATFARGTTVTIRNPGSPPFKMCRCAGWGQFNVMSGYVASKVVKLALFHDGSHGTTQPFSAGRFRGTLEIQHNAVGPISTYVWEAGAYTYVLVFAPSRTGIAVDPLAVIRSFA